jgi:DNA-binding XRE family transcriptional regulator
MSGKRLISMRRLGDGKIAVTTPSPKGRIQVAVCKAGVTAEQVAGAFHGWIPPAAEPSAWRRRRAAIRDRLIECALLEPVLQDRLRREREAAGLTQGQVAQAVGCAQTYITALENGRRDPLATATATATAAEEFIGQLAKAIGCEPSALLG